MDRIAFGLLCSSWLLTAACEETKQVPEVYQGPKNTCQEKADCGGPASCDKALGMCVLRADLSNERYLVRLKPRNRDAEVLEVSPDSDKLVLTLKRREPVTVQFNRVDVFQDGGVQETEVPMSFMGRIVVKDRSATRLDNSPPPKTKQVLSQSVTMSLSPGEERYAFELIPKGTQAETYARQYMDDVTVVESARDTDSSDDTSSAEETDGDSETSTDTDSDTDSDTEGQLLFFPVFPATPLIYGKIKRAPSQPVNGLTVEGLDPETGRSISPETLTRCIDNTTQGVLCGEFDLALVPGHTSYDLKIHRPEEPSYPTVILPDQEVPEEANNNNNNNTPPVRTTFTLAALPALLRYDATVDRPVLLGNGETANEFIEGCTVVFESVDDDIGGGKVVYIAVTNQAGALVGLYGAPEKTPPGIFIYPGKYRITIIPPETVLGAAMDYALFEAEREIGNAGDPEITNQTFSLAFRTRVTARVTSKGVSIPSTLIVSEPLGAASPYARQSRSFVDSDGELVLWMDPGKHRLVAAPPVQSNYAFAFRVIEVPSDPDQLRAIPRMSLGNLQGAIPNVVEMKVKTDDPTIDLEGTEVEWYQILSEEVPPALVARTATDEKGNARVLLPDPATVTND